MPGGRLPIANDYGDARELDADGDGDGNSDTMPGRHLPNTN
jgi:hypothetical protein